MSEDTGIRIPAAGETDQADQDKWNRVYESMKDQGWAKDRNYALTVLNDLVTAGGLQVCYFDDAAAIGGAPWSGTLKAGAAVAIKEADPTYLHTPSGKLYPRVVLADGNTEYKYLGIVNHGWKRPLQDFPAGAPFQPNTVRRWPKVKTTTEIPNQSLILVSRAGFVSCASGVSPTDPASGFVAGQLLYLSATPGVLQAGSDRFALGASKTTYVVPSAILLSPSATESKIITLPHDYLGGISAATKDQSFRFVGVGDFRGLRVGSTDAAAVASESAGVIEVVGTNSSGGTISAGTVVSIMANTAGSPLVYKADAGSTDVNLYSGTIGVAIESVANAALGHFAVFGTIAATAYGSVAGKSVYVGSSSHSSGDQSGKIVELKEVSGNSIADYYDNTGGDAKILPVGSVNAAGHLMLGWHREHGLIDTIRGGITSSGSAAVRGLIAYNKSNLTIKDATVNLVDESTDINIKVAGSGADDSLVDVTMFESKISGSQLWQTDTATATTVAAVDVGTMGGAILKAPVSSALAPLYGTFCMDGRLAWYNESQTTSDFFSGVDSPLTLKVYGTVPVDYNVSKVQVQASVRFNCVSMFSGSTPTHYPSDFSETNNVFWPVYKNTVPAQIIDDYSDSTTATNYKTVCWTLYLVDYETLPSRMLPTGSTGDGSKYLGSALDKFATPSANNNSSFYYNQSGRAWKSNKDFNRSATTADLLLYRTDTDASTGAVESVSGSETTGTLFNGTYTGVATTTTGGGTGCTLTIVVAGAVITGVTVVSTGTGYSTGDTITVLGGLVGGVNGVDDIETTVQSNNVIVTQVCLESAKHKMVRGKRGRYESSIPGTSLLTNNATLLDIKKHTLTGTYITAVNTPKYNNVLSEIVGTAVSGATTNNTCYAFFPRDKRSSPKQVNVGGGQDLLDLKLKAFGKFSCPRVGADTLNLHAYVKEVKANDVLNVDITLTGAATAVNSIWKPVECETDGVATGVGTVSGAGTTGTLVNGTYTGVATSASASGTGCTLTVIVAGGVITSVTPVAPGVDYAIGETLTILGTAVGGATPADDITCTVATHNTVSPSVSNSYHQWNVPMPSDDTVIGWWVKISRTGTTNINSKEEFFVLTNLQLEQDFDSGTRDNYRNVISPIPDYYNQTKNTSGIIDVPDDIYEHHVASVEMFRPGVSSAELATNKFTRTTDIVGYGPLQNTGASPFKTAIWTSALDYRYDDKSGLTVDVISAVTSSGGTVDYELYARYEDCFNSADASSSNRYYIGKIAVANSAAIAGSSARYLRHSFVVPPAALWDTVDSVKFYDNPDYTDGRNKGVVRFELVRADTQAYASIIVGAVVQSPHGNKTKLGEVSTININERTNLPSAMGSDSGVSNPVYIPGYTRSDSYRSLDVSVQRFTWGFGSPQNRGLPSCAAGGALFLIPNNVCTGDNMYPDIGAAFQEGYYVPYSFVITDVYGTVSVGTGSAYDPVRGDLEYGGTTGGSFGGDPGLLPVGDPTGVIVLSLSEISSATTTAQMSYVPAGGPSRVMSPIIGNTARGITGPLGSGIAKTAIVASGVQNLPLVLLPNSAGVIRWNGSSMSNNGTWVPNAKKFPTVYLPADYMKLGPYHPAGFPWQLNATYVNTESTVTGRSRDIKANITVEVALVHNPEDQHYSMMGGSVSKGRSWWQVPSAYNARLPRVSDIGIDTTILRQWVSPTLNDPAAQAQRVGVFTLPGTPVSSRRSPPYDPTVSSLGVSVPQRTINAWLQQTASSKIRIIMNAADSGPGPTITVYGADYQGNLVNNSVTVAGTTTDIPTAVAAPNDGWTRVDAITTTAAPTHADGYTICAETVPTVVFGKLPQSRDMWGVWSINSANGGIIHNNTGANRATVFIIEANTYSPRNQFRRVPVFGTAAGTFTHTAERLQIQADATLWKATSNWASPSATLSSITHIGVTDWDYYDSSLLGSPLLFGFHDTTYQHPPWPVGLKAMCAVFDPADVGLVVHVSGFDTGGAAVTNQPVTVTLWDPKNTTPTWNTGLSTLGEITTITWPTRAPYGEWLLGNFEVPWRDESSDASDETNGVYIAYGSVLY
jgi:hypothetical protein